MARSTRRSYEYSWRDYAFESEAGRRGPSAFLYALPCVAVWAAYLLVFFPGLMSMDSLVQWQQMQTMHLSDSHPVFHTLLNWTLTRLWESPAAIALAQIFALSLVFGAAMAQLERLGVPVWVRVLLTAFVCLLPTNGMMVLNLWKDVPYSISLLWLTVLCLKVFQSDGAWLSERRHQAVLGISLLFVILLRHNGILPATATLLGIGIVYREQWRRALIIGAVCMLTIVTVKGPVYESLQVQPGERWQALSLPVHQIGAMVRAGVAVQPEDRELLASLLPMEEWGRSYWPYMVDTLVHHPHFQKQILNEKSGEFVRLWVRLVAEHPHVAFVDGARLTSLVWSVPQPADGYTYTTQRGIDANKMGLRLAHPLPPERENAVRLLVAWTEEPARVWWMWRPALYLYALCALAVVAAIRLGREALLVTVPILANAAGLLVTLPAQDVRYLYGALLIAPVIAGLAFAKEDRVGRAHPFWK